MKTVTRAAKWTIGYGVFALSLAALVSACGIGSHDIPRFGIGGRYQEGEDQILRGRTGNMDKAVAALESVVKEDPTYKDSLTLLARAYYQKGRYKDAYLIVQRALSLNAEDEIAWLILGLTQMRLGQGEKGLESLKGGITLFAKASSNGYRNFEYWDTNGRVRAYLRRTVLFATKGLDDKENLVRSTETLLAEISTEVRLQRVESKLEERKDQGGDN